MPGVKRKQKCSSDEEGSPPGLKKAKINGGPLSTTEDTDDSVVAEHKRLGKLSKFSIAKATRKALKARGVKYLFPIQYLTFEHIHSGKDLIGQARTGTGKTLSFVLPLLEVLRNDEGPKRKMKGRPPSVLVLAPTRELASQVHEEFKALLPEGITSFCVYGGAPYEPQEFAIRRGLDVLVGTPGRILDHMGRDLLNLSELRHVVLDEADQMLERGFAESVEEILAASFEDASTSKPQLLLFSATVPEWVLETAERYMKEDRVVVDLIGGEAVRTATGVQHYALCCPYTERPSTIADIIQVYSGAHGRAVVFTATKADANELALSSQLKQECQLLHGDIPQKQRERTLKSFREGRFSVLVATDVAARGLDIPEVDLVVQCEPPKDVDSYIHRSGRTGRAGRTGISIMFYKPREEFRIPIVERRAGITFQRIGAPQTGDIIKAAARDAVRSLSEVSSSVLPYFSEAAAQFIEEKGPTEALAAALAYISGSTEIVSRSLLSAQQDYTTYLLHCSEPVRHQGYFWKVLERSFPPEVKEATRGMRLCKDSKGVVFDLPNEFSSVIKEHWEDGYVKLSVPESLPELKERPPDFYDRMRTGRGGMNGGRAGPSWSVARRPGTAATNGFRRGFRGGSHGSQSTYRTSRH